MDDVDHLAILSTVRELPFHVGKSTLVDILSGAVTKKMVVNDTYMELQGYGSLEGASKDAIATMVDKLVRNGLLRIESPEDKPYWKLLALTARGAKELKEPSFQDAAYTGHFETDAMDADSKALMEQFSFFLERYNDEQRHAIVCPARRVRCVAGAGSGKTAVLTARAQFLTRFRGVAPEDVLAITFTRKARKELQERLGTPVHATTFNAFCERLLRKNGQGKPLVMYKQRIQLFREAIAGMGIEPAALVHEYFTPAQRKEHQKDELLRRLMSDVYGILDHYANEDADIPTTGASPLATTLLRVARRIAQAMDEKGVRDYSGQLRDALSFLRKRPEAIPRYEHVLVDEYQDVNTAQQALLELLSPKHLFVVGDPRQSIFGWRGSQVGFITEFDADVTVQLRKNYRSARRVIELMNATIAPMGLPDLATTTEEEGALQVLFYKNEDEERAGVASLLAAANHDDVFVLARTNRQLEELSALLSRNGVAHTLRHEEDETDATGITLSTVHAIKGLEARAVIVMGCAERHFPCKVSDHPVMDLIKDPSFDKEEEELRLLYVALSRAKETLVLTHAGAQSRFLEKPLAPKRHGRDDGAYERLRRWRAQQAASKGLPAYCICTDKTLRELTELRPRTAGELEQVHGMGPARVAEYGDALLAELQKL